MYYGLIILSVLMFGGCFALQDNYHKMRGSGLKISLETAFVGSVAGFAVLFVFNGFQIEFTVFTFLIAAFASLDGIAFTFCSFKALDTINLSLFSLFSMLGGMVLPFLQGIVIYGEKLTIAKVLCLLLIGAALCLTVSQGEKKSGTIYYVGVFVLNGMSGVLSKIFASSTLNKTSSIGYSIWIAICTAVISGLLLILLRSQKVQTPYTPKMFGISASQGAINRIANLLLVVALAHVDASVQYPMVTGGTMLASTLICFFGPRKPSKKELISVTSAFVGLLILFVVPV